METKAPNAKHYTTNDCCPECGNQLEANGMDDDLPICGCCLWPHEWTTDISGTDEHEQTFFEPFDCEGLRYSALDILGICGKPGFAAAGPCDGLWLTAAAFGDEGKFFVFEMLKDAPLDERYEFCGEYHSAPRSSSIADIRQAAEYIIERIGNC